MSWWRSGQKVRESAMTRTMYLELFFYRSEKNPDYYYITDVKNKRKIGWYHYTKVEKLGLLSKMDTTGIDRTIEKFSSDQTMKAFGYHPFFKSNPKQLTDQHVDENWIRDNIKSLPDNPSG